MPKYNKSLVTSKSLPSEEHSGIKKKQNTQTVLVNSIRKKKIDRAIKNDYETEKAKKEEEKNDFLSKMSEEFNPTSTEGQFEMMRGLMKKTTKKSGLDIFDDEEMEESKKKDEESIDENHLVKTSEQQVSILEKVLSKKKKSEELKQKYEKKEAMEKVAMEQLPFSKPSTTTSTKSTKSTTPSSTTTPSSNSVKSSTTTTDFIPLAVPQTEVKTIDKDLPFVKAPISKTICLHCERERTIRGLMIKYVIITNDQDEVIYHAASEDTLRAIAEDKEAAAQSNIPLGEVTYSLLTIREHLSKIFRKTFVIIGYTIYNDMIGIFGPRNIREFQSKLRDVGIVDPNTEQPLDRSMLTNVSVLLTKLLGLNNAKKMNRVETATNIYKAYKLHSKIFDQYSKQSSLDLLGFEERQLIKREKKVQYQQKYMTAINGGIDNILAQMKNK